MTPWFRSLELAGRWNTHSPGDKGRQHLEAIIPELLYLSPIPFVMNHSQYQQSLCHKPGKIFSSSSQEGSGDFHGGQGGQGSSCQVTGELGTAEKGTWRHLKEESHSDKEYSNLSPLPELWCDAVALPTLYF